ncbi:TPA: hypothetical protein ACPY5O_001996 [Yersinia enterocolitica]|uniref:hypothetical protein n=1 Tax=Yersinia enterocolitica TaxID=630 RepID=UPI001C8D22EE|nr:hypothetical protein [Yersinia enterocolitica]EKN6164914.1 hypothetical protein [Yersinia enterocolitica]MBX9477067.1 hypothetical protein [Yersinia enterocolitica]HDL6674485.1 hypothetical protein [Yersinia enterocolitica]HDL7124452.1 hypothetical protein [Yersinia enterocolitica]HDL7207385.1 hypothetical protein [Yersinia enterocolitica]
MRLVKSEDGFIIKPGGVKLGPYDTTFAGDTIFVNDQSADIDEGDTIMRILPNSKEEKKVISAVIFHSRGIAGRGPHYQLKTKPWVPAMQKTQNITINGNNVQIGDHNSQEIRNHITNIIEAIDKSEASDKDKAEAKGILRTFLEHPLVSTLAGVAASSLLS